MRGSLWKIFSIPAVSVVTSAHAEELPERVDPAERVDDALVEEVSPEPDAAHRAQHVCREELGVAERLVNVSQHVLNHEAPYPGPRVDGGEDEERLEEDREVV